MIGDLLARLRGRTVVEESLFRLVLPSGWRTEPPVEELCWLYSSDAPRQQLTVTLRKAASPCKSDQRRQALGELLRLRREADLKVTPIPPTLTDPDIMAEDEIDSAAYEGFQSETGRILSCCIMVSPSLLATFYFEGFGLRPKAAIDTATQILSSVRLFDPLWNGA